MPTITITDLTNAKTDVDHLAAIANSTSPTATDRLGNTKKTLAGLSAEFPNASNNANIATTQAGIAITNANTATTQANLAAASKVAAESARDSALIQAGVYTTEALGRAAVTDGQAFKVQGSGDVAAYEYRRTNSGASVLIATYPSAGMVMALPASMTLRSFHAQKNLFDSSRATASAYVRYTDGIIITGVGGFYASDLIWVTPGGSLTTLYALYGGSGVVGHAFYSASVAYISGSAAGTAAGGTITVPSDAAYIRFTIEAAASGFAKTMVVNGTTVPTAFHAFETIDDFTFRARFLQRMRECFSHTANLFNPDAVTIGYFINTVTGTLSANAGWNTSDFIPVEEGISYIGTYSSNSGQVGIVWYAADQSTIVGVLANYVAGSTGTAPIGAAFARYSFDNTSSRGRPTLPRVGFYRSATLPKTVGAYGYTDDQQVAERSQKQMRGNMPKLRNLFRRRDATLGYFLGTYTGLPSANAVFLYSDYMAVRPGDTLCANLEQQPGYSATAWVFYDRDKNLAGYAMATGATATTTSGSNVVNVTALGTYFNLPLGTPISGTGIPAGAYITATPVDGPNVLGNYTISSNATASGSIANFIGGGVLANIPLTIPANTAFTRVSHFSDKAWALEITDGVRATGDVTVGWDDVSQTKPWSGQPVCVIGDSQTQGISDGGAQGFAYGYFMSPLQHMTQANLVYPAGTGGRKLREVLDTSSAYYTPALVSTSFDSSSVFANGGLVLAMAGTNDFGVPNSGASYIGGRPLGVLGDTWIPSDITITLTSGNATATVTTTSRGALSNGMPIAGSPGTTGIPNGTTIQSLGTYAAGTGTVTLSAPATTSGTITAIGGTFHGDLYDVFVRKLITWQPYLTIGLITPFPRFDDGVTTGLFAGNPQNPTTGNRLSDYADAIKNFAERWGFACLDVFRSSGINAANFSTLMISSDKLHPKYTYYQRRFVGMVAKFANSLA